MATVRDFFEYINSIAPIDTQESWDNSGFLVGNGEKEVTKVLVALDATENVLNEAAEKGAELIITHHPVIFGALKEFHPENIAFLATEKEIAIISEHTCLDIADGGVNDCLAAALELENVVKVDDGEGLMRMGELEGSLSCEDFVKYVAEKLSVGGQRNGLSAFRTDPPVVIYSNDQFHSAPQIAMGISKLKGWN